MRAAPVKKMKHVWWSRPGHGEVMAWSHDHGGAQGGCAGLAARCAKRGAGMRRRGRAGRAKSADSWARLSRGPVRDAGARLQYAADGDSRPGCWPVETGPRLSLAGRLSRHGRRKRARPPAASRRRPPTHMRGRSRPAPSEALVATAGCWGPAGATHEPIS